MEELAGALRLPQEPLTDELHVRRERTRLLAAFDTPSAPARPRGRAWTMAAGLALAGGLSFVLAWRKAPAPPVTSTPTQANVVVTADSDARWSRHSEAQREIVALQSGALFVRVGPGSTRRLLVKLPDGELEDIGTVFSVSVAQGQTTRVTVQEGSVVLRLNGQAPIALGAGEAWVPPLPALPASGAAPAPSAPQRTRPAARTTPRATLSTEPATDAAADFRAAMAAFNEGNETRAAELFSSFIHRYPGDSRAEDAAYLRALAYQRVGNESATQRAAREYLTLYPRGFRRAEVETLLRTRND